jgi:BCD family chlorophyll transporter-like MFS transporter
MSRARLLRLGLFQLAAGSTSVIFLGVVNRVMRVELGIDLFVVSLLVGGGHYLGALIAIPFGHFSDTHRLAGYRRTAYALGGALVTAALLAVSPFVVAWLAQHQTVLGFVLGLGFFLLEGLSTYIAGTAYLSLIADLTTEAERGPATGMAWTLLMVGIIVTGVGTGLILRGYSFAAFLALTLSAAGVAVVLPAVALYHQEPRRAGAGLADEKASPGLRAALGVLLSSAQTRWFAGFLLLALFSFFMQDVVLEPFGGEVFGLSAAQTARFNAYMGTGVIVGMLLGGMRLIPRAGKTRITAVGCALMVAAFGVLVFASLAEQAPWISPAILALGFGSGLFTVGGVSLMMDMTSAEHTGLFVGAWTLIQASAKGPASIAGGALVSALLNAGGTAGQAYAGVFAVEAVGLLAALAFLSRVGVQTFRREVASFASLAAEAMD